MKTYTTFAEQFKSENQGKWVWYNGAMGLTDALLNDYIESSREEAVQKMANRDNVPYEEVDNDYNNWYYILPVEEIEDDYLNTYALEYL
ncbi:hypothetical protein HER18_02835 [Chryseobacterium sp. NEB161]|nr:hypothetical protein HER18_02835 [Chryseobacterium sp. NEB161]